jgi:hypothetical protein
MRATHASFQNTKVALHVARYNVILESPVHSLLDELANRPADVTVAGTHLSAILDERHRHRSWP